MFWHEKEIITSLFSMQFFLNNSKAIMTKHKRLFDYSSKGITATSYYLPATTNTFRYPVCLIGVSYLIISRYLCLCLVSISVTVTSFRMLACCLANVCNSAKWETQMW